MRYVTRFVLVFGTGFVAYVWLTSEVPGGEKRYQHYVRQFKDRHSSGRI